MLSTKAVVRTIPRYEILMRLMMTVKSSDSTEALLKVALHVLIMILAQ
jgi:hypothetical protein